MANDDISQFKRPAVAVDVVVFTIKEDDLKVGVIEREEEPFLGKFALPGRFVRYDEPIEETARQALKLKANINPDVVFLEQLYTFGQDLNRDDRIRTISVVYYALVDSSRIDFQPGQKFHWRSVYNLPLLAFDHKILIDYALKRLRNKVIESDFAFQLMPEEFTLTELQRAYEIILDERQDKRNFRKKIFELKLVKPLHKKQAEGAHRPAELYTFTRKR